jgi:hypothetical protein
MFGYKKIVICYECKNETEDWEWLYDLTLEKAYPICTEHLPPEEDE